MNHLYIIGNGFDLHHGAKSSYSDFRNYLWRRNKYVAKSFELFFGPNHWSNYFDNIDDFISWLEPDSGYPLCHINWIENYLWKDFENSLSKLNRENVFDFVEPLLPEDMDDEDFTYAKFFAPIDTVSDIVNSCSFEMQYIFHRWVNTLHYCKGFKNKMLKLDPTARFLNFNYTLFLETEYNINKEQILYIHGNRRQKFGKLILGHNKTDYSTELDKWIAENKNRKTFANDDLIYLTYFLEDESKGNWKNPIRFYASDYIRSRLENYFEKNIKNCDQIIEANKEFFHSLDDIKEITVVGHSLGNIDFPYFQAIVANIDNPESTKWNFSFYNENDLDNIYRFCKQLNISEKNFRTFQLTEIML